MGEEVMRTHYTKVGALRYPLPFVVRPAGLCRLSLLTCSAGLRSDGGGRIGI
jgi:hypothetical protein